MITPDSRMQETIRYLQAEGFEALVATYHGQNVFANVFIDSNPVYVLSGVRPIAESAVVVQRSGRSTLVVSPAWDAERAAASSRTDDTLGCDDLADGLARALRSARIDPAKVLTLGLPLLGLALARRIESVLGGARPANESLTNELARVRNPAELAAARKATWIAERGYERMREIARPGMREFELAADLYCHMKELGAEDDFLLVSASQHNLAVRAAGHRMLDVGDIILSEITPCYRGQFVQICRTTVIGEPLPIVREKYEILKAAMKRGQAAAVPGTKVGDVANAINDCFREAGYAKYCRPPYMRVRGHGLGITSDRPGDISEDSNVVLEEGMVFVMHPNQYIPETGYLMCGEPVLITASGAQSLSARDAELDFIPV